MIYKAFYILFYAYYLDAKMKPKKDFIGRHLLLNQCRKYLRECQSGQMGEIKALVA